MRKKQLKCPVCGQRIIDASDKNISELVAEANMKPGWDPDYYQKRPKCKKQIGIKKVS